MLIRLPLVMPPVVKPHKRHIVRTYFFGVLGVVIGLAFLIFFFGFLAALD